jgi:hypothetical protein
MTALELTVEMAPAHVQTPGLFSAWLSVDGVTVAFLHGRALAEDLYSTQYENYKTASKGVWLYDIETREGYRNQGFSKEILKRTAEHFGFDEVQHTGGYTPDGFDYVSKNVTRPYGATPQTRATFSQQTFVHDWDLRQAKR